MLSFYLIDFIFQSYVVLENINIFYTLSTIHFISTHNVHSINYICYIQL